MKGSKRKKREKVVRKKSSIKLTAWWHNLKIGYKFGVAFTFTILLFCLSAFIIFIQLFNISNEMKEVKKSGEQSILITEIASVFNQLGSEISIYIQDSNGKHVTSFQDLSKQYDELSKELKPSLTTIELQLYNKVGENKQKLTTLFDDKVFPAVVSANKLSSIESSQEAEQIIKDTVRQLDQLRANIKVKSDRSITAANSNVSGTIVVLLVSIVASTIIAILSLVMIGRNIGKQLKNLVIISNRVADGNLKVEEIEIKGQDEIGLLSKSLNIMNSSLRSMIREITTVSDQVASKSSELMISSSEVKAASQQIASTVQELSTGAEEQAHSSTQLAKMMEEYAGKIQTANQNGSQINESSQHVLEMTKKGHEFMNASTEQMNKINSIMEFSVEKVKGLDEQTKQISTLVKVIRDIADQTNLLALNAAIEAARAGEHGRGFAVVADEVRKLAEQVSHSVKDITDIVNSIQKESNSVARVLLDGYSQVDEGANQIQVTGQTFEDIHDAVTVMVERIRSISENLDIIAGSTVEINLSIDNIAAVSEQSAAGIEQTSASVQQTNSSMETISDHSELLSDLASRLNTLISKFKL
ncbi:HAMP domain-containing methyl-accepting chemotaxis protein [Fredinandcohnia sp. QZ13]|uniref:methyl-accepting chemotaxis protein n=1 Tax=Fredinandcohnia sp. QZ13 TaxID=3073144 RepID=UPI0028536973|nr:HAMP domain-containing methyl-accepting chemotaxis protein [Fredinandcohnia sp. QZ13]MDR4886932.1 HAMP domain-containing methyl-accepting chemotaxis protein [Fredinandcohnia sp. QZ13]